eukprot:1106260-Amphidinium_carterae.1
MATNMLPRMEFVSCPHQTGRGSLGAWSKPISVGTVDVRRERRFAQKVGFRWFRVVACSNAQNTTGPSTAPRREVSTSF